MPKKHPNKPTKAEIAADSRDKSLSLEEWIVDPYYWSNAFNEDSPISSWPGLTPTLELELRTKHVLGVPLDPFSYITLTPPRAKKSLPVTSWAYPYAGIYLRWEEHGLLVEEASRGWDRPFDSKLLGLLLARHVDFSGEDRELFWAYVNSTIRKFTFTKGYRGSLKLIEKTLLKEPPVWSSSPKAGGDYILEASTRRPCRETAQL
jgi:hypothetical protein